MTPVERYVQGLLRKAKQFGQARGDSHVPPWTSEIIEKLTEHPDWWTEEWFPLAGRWAYSGWPVEVWQEIMDKHGDQPQHGHRLAPGGREAVRK